MDGHDLVVRVRRKYHILGHYQTGIALEHFERRVGDGEVERMVFVKWDDPGWASSAVRMSELVFRVRCGCQYRTHPSA